MISKKHQLQRLFSENLVRIQRSPATAQELYDRRTFKSLAALLIRPPHERARLRRGDRGRRDLQRRQVIPA